MNWKIRIGESDFETGSLDVIKQWITEGRVLPEHYLYHPLLEKWMYVRDVEELKPWLKARSKISNKSGSLERNVLVGCCILSLLMFFFPLITIHIPIAGDQNVSGYDVFSKLSDFRQKLSAPSGVTSEPSGAVSSEPSSAVPTQQSVDMPVSLKVAWLLPLTLIGAFVLAGIALVTGFKTIETSRISSLFGALFAGIAILHTTIMNSDVHSWMAESMKNSQAELKDNPFAGLAENLGSLMANAFQIKPGWGTYALLLLLVIASIIGFSGILSRLRVE